MPQSLIQIPESAEFDIEGYTITIRDHKVVYVGGLHGEILYLIRSKTSYRDMLYQLEKHGISFEAAIECCSQELVEREHVLANTIYWLYDTVGKIKMTGKKNTQEVIIDFSKSAAGRKIAEQFVEKIRSCGNWGELYDELQLTTKFNRDMEERIIKEIKEQNKTKKEMKQQCRKV